MYVSFIWLLTYKQTNVQQRGAEIHRLSAPVVAADFILTWYRGAVTNTKGVGFPAF